MQNIAIALKTSISAIREKSTAELANFVSSQPGRVLSDTADDTLIQLFSRLLTRSMIAPGILGTIWESTGSPANQGHECGSQDRQLFKQSAKNPALDVKNIWRNKLPVENIGFDVVECKCRRCLGLESTFLGRYVHLLGENSSTGFRLRSVLDSEPTFHFKQCFDQKYCRSRFSATCFFKSNYGNLV